MSQLLCYVEQTVRLFSLPPYLSHRDGSGLWLAFTSNCSVLILFVSLFFEFVPTHEAWVTGLSTRQRASGVSLGAISLFLVEVEVGTGNTRKRLFGPKVVRKDSPLLQSVHDPAGRWSREVAPRNI
jgi:hypothetical protein